MGAHGAGCVWGSSESTEAWVLCIRKNYFLSPPFLILNFLHEDGLRLSGCKPVEETNEVSGPHRSGL